MWAIVYGIDSSVYNSFLSNLFVHMLYLLVYSWKSCWWKRCLVFLICGQNNEQTHKHCIYFEIITKWDFLFWLLFKSLCIKIHLCRYFEISLHGATCSTLWLVSPVTKLHQEGKKVSVCFESHSPLVFHQNFHLLVTAQCLRRNAFTFFDDISKMYFCMWVYSITH